MSSEALNLSHFVFTFSEQQDHRDIYRQFYIFKMKFRMKAYAYKQYWQTEQTGYSKSKLYAIISSNGEYLHSITNHVVSLSIFGTAKWINTK